MALIRCSECKGQVSTQARTCPHCGAKVVKPRGRGIWIAGALLAICVVAGVMGQNGAVTSKPKSAEQAAVDAERTKRLQVVGAGAMQLKQSAKDPATFDLTSALLMPSGSGCYQFRAVNSFGAVLPSSAVQTAAGKLFVKQLHGKEFATAWNKECANQQGEEIAPVLKKLKIV